MAGEEKVATVAPEEVFNNDLEVELIGMVEHQEKAKERACT